MTATAHAPTMRAALSEALAAAVRGEVRFSAGDRALYATDSSNYRQVPIGVVLPRDAEDVVRAVEVARRFGAPVLPRGAGTSLAGQCTNAAVVLDLSRYLNGRPAVDPDRRTARVQPGVVLDDLRAEAERHHLTFGPDPATHNRCTLGGMIGNNSCGVHSVMAGLTSDNVEELDILTYDGLRMRAGRTAPDELEAIIAAGGRRGAIYAGLKQLVERYAPQIRAQFPPIPRCVTGYNLVDLLPENGFHVARALVGSEGTCVTVLEATVNLVHSPPYRSLLVLGYPTVYEAADHVPAIMAHGPTGLEGFDDLLVKDIRAKGLHRQGTALLPRGGGWLLVEFGGESKAEAEGRARGLMDALHGAGGVDMRLLRTGEEETAVWEVRESGLGATAYVPGEAPTWPGWEDSAVPPERFGGYLRDLRALLDRYGFHDAAYYGHFGQGCLHTRIAFDFATAQGIRQFNSFINDAADLVVRYGGSLSGEHGDGQARAALLPKMFGPELMEAFRQFKAIWDPDNRMNPGKVIDAYQPDQNLRLGTAYEPRTPRTFFAFPQDEGSFTHAMLRCVGVGKCRRHGGGTMCPSYMVTRREEHSTRGRARLLFEMMRGDVLTGGWRNHAVREALDLCLACKGCKGDCPTNVDMATYKAEFLAHYYARRLRPVSAYSMGLIYWWARLAAHAPALANFFTQTPGLRALAGRLAGVAPERRLPVFARRTFRAWWQQRGPSRGGGPEVILWPDTFNNHFHPETAQAAAEALEALGFQVIVPAGQLCCGRPLYDFGFLTQARHLLRQILAALSDDIRRGVPVVVLEPSCASVFRDELVNLFPHDQDARRLHDQTFLLSEFLQRYAGDADLPPLNTSALVHGHCHHKALMGMADEQTVLDRLGVSYRSPEDGCCGMAGAFGFEREHYSVSIACGERVLLPAVRSAEESTLVVADGFSCREQIEQTTGRRPLHLAEVLHAALRGNPPA